MTTLQLERKDKIQKNKKNNIISIKFNRNLNSWIKYFEEIKKNYKSLEERNLFLIANTKDREQMFEELKHKFEIRKKILDENFEIDGLREFKEMLIKLKKEIKHEWIANYNRIVIVDDSPNVWMNDSDKIDFLVLKHT